MPSSARQRHDACQAELAPEAGGIRIALAGEVDLRCELLLNGLVHEVYSAPPADVTVDLAAVTFLGSMGLEFLVTLYVHATGQGQRFILANPRPIARRALAVSGLDAVFREAIHGSAVSEQDA